MVARTVTDVVLGEATYGTKQQRFNDMLAIASVIANRSALHGVTPQQVVANQREFNAYGKALPKGANAYRDLAERAIRQVQEQGPIHRGTFYATPSATKNLPRGLSQVARTSGHVYYSDPQRRPINTAVGTKRYQDKPTAMAYAPAPQKVGALAAIDRITQPSRVATPTARPQVQGPQRPAMDASRFGAPTQPAMTQDMRNSLAERYGGKAGRVPSPAVSASTIARPSARPSVPQSLTPAQERNLASRLTPQTSLAMAPRPTPAPRSVSVAAPVGVERAASLPSGLQPAKGARVASAPVSRPTALSAPQAANLASRLGPVEKTPSVSSLRTAAPVTIGSVLGISPAAAATRTPTTAPVSRPSAPVSAAPARTNFAGPAGSPRSVDGRLNAALNTQLRSVNPMVSQAPARPAAVTPTARPSLTAPISARALAAPTTPTLTSFSPRTPVAPSNLMARSVPTPTSRPVTEARVVSAPAARIATPTSRPTSRPTIAAPQAISSRPATRTASVAPAPQAPRSVAAPTARDAWGGLRTVAAAAPAAPTAAPATGFASRLGITPGRIGGALVGSMVAGPIGAIAGGFLGGRIGTAVANRPGPSFGGNGMNNASSSNGFGGGMNGMGGNQGSSLNGAGIGGGMADRFGGFRGFSGDSSSTPGPDGGKVGGGSRSSSSSGGKSSGGGKGKK